jgi:hypothetical protein
LTEDYGKYAVFDECIPMGMDVPIWIFGINSEYKMVPIDTRNGLDTKEIAAIITFDNSTSLLRIKAISNKMKRESTSSYLKDFIDEAIAKCMKDGNSYDPDLFEARVLDSKKRLFKMYYCESFHMDMKKVFSEIFFRRSTSETDINGVTVINTPFGKAYKTDVANVLANEELMKSFADKYDAYDITGALKKIENFKDLIQDHAFFLFAVEGNDVFLSCVRSAVFEPGQDKSKTPCLIL